MTAELPPAALHFPATHRNRAPLLEVLRRVLAPPVAEVLEIACGSGEHALYFAANLPWLRWRPTDPNAEHVASAEAWRAHTGTPNLAPARALDVHDPGWSQREGRADALFVANMFHIAPWQATIDLFAGAAQLLAPGGLVVSYGPYRRAGVPTAPSNEAFDASLRSRDPRWGVRALEEIAAIAPAFTLEEIVDMPANNLSLIWRRI